MFDRDTGKPKGYGFCEYADAQTALSAMRNLNGWEMGGRPLRVDFAESEKGSDMMMMSAGGAGGQWNNTPAVRKQFTSANLLGFRQRCPSYPTKCKCKKRYRQSS